MRVVTFGLVLACVAVACSGGGGNGALNGDGGSSANGGDGGGGNGAVLDASAKNETSSVATEGEVTASPHDPQSGCREGFEACGKYCVDKTSDSRHCGDCSKACGYAADAGSMTTCVESACVLSTPGCTTFKCDNACVARGSVEHCGSCFNRCGDRQLCDSDTCVDAKGDGKSCGTAMVIPDDDNFEFRYPATLVSNHVFQCSGGAAVPTRWFKWTSDDTHTVKVQVKSPEPTDDYVVAVYSSAQCDDEVLVGCNDTDNNRPLPELQVAVTAGKTYWIAVGRVSAKAGVNPSVRVDD